MLISCFDEDNDRGFETSSHASCPAQTNPLHHRGPLKQHKVIKRMAAELFSARSYNAQRGLHGCAISKLFI